MNSTIIDGTNIDTRVFSYSSPKAYPKGGKVVNLYNKYTKESLCISTPLILTWGAQESMDQQKNPTGKFTMSLQFPTQEYSNDSLDAFLNSMKELEKAVKNSAMEYSKEWFGKNITSSEVMEEKFNVMLRHPKVKGTQEIDYNKPPTLTVKVPCWNEVWQSEIYDEEGNQLYFKGKHEGVTPLDFLKPKTHVICLLQCGGLWFVNGKVSITWNLKQAIVKKPKEVVEGICLLNIKSEDKDKLKLMEEPEVLTSETDVVNSVIVDDSDDEDNNIEEGYSVIVQGETEKEPEPEPEPEKKPEVPETNEEVVVETKKKRVVKKKK